MRKSLLIHHLSESPRTTRQIKNRRRLFYSGINGFNKKIPENEIQAGKIGIKLHHEKHEWFIFKTS